MTPNNNKKITLEKYVKKEEHVLAFQFKEMYQPEVLEAVNLGIAEIVDAQLGRTTQEEHLLIKTAVDKKGRSRWTNIHKGECVVMNYFITTDNTVVVDKAKKISRDSLVNNYRKDLDDEPSLFEKDLAEKVIDAARELENIEREKDTQKLTDLSKMSKQVRDKEEKKSKKSKKA